MIRMTESVDLTALSATSAKNLNCSMSISELRAQSKPNTHHPFGSLIAKYDRCCGISLKKEEYVYDEEFIDATNAIINDEVDIDLPATQPFSTKNQSRESCKSIVPVMISWYHERGWALVLMMLILLRI